ncbi:hypothetical protein HanXRQr2_Chr01g0004381 [Helianthus annuus]|uniref:Uncharacterized protein n=1 Tax=Helianthus annuus TaxID=4232 RepID=A0A9K3JU76_HELAN|nr:hypothetical protein HanXRQr2_Chr01g0004381 [Helianthus annuus]
MNHHHRLSPPWYISLSITTEFSPKALSLSLITCLISPIMRSCLKPSPKHLYR